MGFFERKLGALGEAMDEGLDRARDRTQELCDRRGWADRAGTLRERMRDRSAEAGDLLHRGWRDIGEKGRKRAVAGAAFCLVLLLVAGFRAAAFREKPLPGASEIELVTTLRERSRSHSPWSTSPTDATPWGAPGR